jgi:hypothetical protein
MGGDAVRRYPAAELTIFPATIALSAWLPLTYHWPAGAEQCRDDVIVSSGIPNGFQYLGNWIIDPAHYYRDYQCLQLGRFQTVRFWRKF